MCCMSILHMYEQSVLKFCRITFQKIEYVNWFRKRLILDYWIGDLNKLDYLQKKIVLNIVSAVDNKAMKIKIELGGSNRITLYFHYEIKYKRHPSSAIMKYISVHLKKNSFLNELSNEKWFKLAACICSENFLTVERFTLLSTSNNECAGPECNLQSLFRKVYVVYRLTRRIIRWLESHLWN